ncbi:MAG: glycosyltransferase [Halieaceae bacterium]|nr:glycosyltransferase [Halieaceae bacterium]
MQPIDIIVPVYDGLEEVRDCLTSVLDSRQVAPCEVTVINDASPNAEVTSYLRELARDQRLTLLENESNLGFVRTVNRGMSLNPERDVVLLNSDTVVHGNWLDRLVAQAYAADEIGTVTPFSNNAEICSFPRLCDTNAADSADQLPLVDSVLAEALTGRSVDIPTAVGFCMYIRRACIDAVGLFDADTFGRGYGEENDFCMRAAREGWRHILAADCYVRHVGGVSFSEHKQALIGKALEILDRRYPTYHADVARWIETDPPYALRCKGLLEVLRQDPRQKVLAITHNLGGGTEKHVRELADATDANSALLMLKPFAGTQLRLTLGVDDAVPGLNFDWADSNQQDSLLRLLRHLNVTRAHIHHVFGLEEILPGLLAKLALPYDITLHDYFLIDGNPTLTDEDGIFQVERKDRGAGCNTTRLIENDAELQDWQRGHQQLLEGAERVFSPSRAALEQHEVVYRLPNAVVTGHVDMVGVDVLPVSPPRKDLADRPLQVLVLGALSIEKGANLLEDTALLAQQENAPIKFTLLGYAYRTLRGLETLGAYTDDQLDQLIAGQDPDVIWFPCRWPETYSYTLSAALRSGRPLVVPNVGSFPERVEGRPLTWLEAYDKDATHYLKRLEETRELLLGKAPGQAVDWQAPKIGDFRYDANYRRPSQAVGHDLDFSLEDVTTHMAGVDLRPRDPDASWLLRLLGWLKRRSWLSWLMRRVPMRWQHALRRRL